MRAARLDDKRRATFPQECPPHSLVTFQQIDADTWIVRRQTGHPVSVIAIPLVEQLRDDAEMDGFAAAAVHSGALYTEPHE